MLNANTQLHDKVIDRAAMIRLYEDSVNAKVGLLIDGHELRLDNILNGSKLDSKDFSRVRGLVDKELAKAYKSLYNETKKSFLELFADQTSYAYQNVETTMGKIWRTQRPTRRVAEEVVLESPLFKDTNMSAGWGKLQVNERQRLSSIIRKGISDGDTANEIALKVRKGNVHKITRQHSMTLVATGITSVHNQADHAVYKANAKALKGWQYVAVLDSATTPICVERDAKVYKVEDSVHLPPAHYGCRSTTTPVFKSWDDIGKLEGVAEIRRRNLEKLSKKQKAFYDGQVPDQEVYDNWLRRQNSDVQLRHLGSTAKVKMFQAGRLNISKFTKPDGKPTGINELRQLTDPYTMPGDTRRFQKAKAKLDSIQLGISSPEDIYSNPEFKKRLREYYLLQAGELDGTLSYTNYRGLLIHNKKAMRRKVLASPPREDQIKWNPITSKYEDARLYQPNIGAFNNNIKLVEESAKLKAVDKEFIKEFIGTLDDKMGVNEKAVITDNLRIIFGRYRDNPEPWVNFKAVVQAQIKFDVTNVSDAIETQLRSGSDVLKKLTQANYIDPVLGPVQLDDLHDNFISNILARNKWEDTVAPKIARELRGVLDSAIIKSNPRVWQRLDEGTLQQFYLKMAHRLSMADGPDRDSFAVAMGRDLYNLANFNGSRNEWYKLGMSLLEVPKAAKFFKVETFGVQKKRLKSKMSGQYFGPYYDTLSYNIRVVDDRIQKYAHLKRKVDVGLRVGVTTAENRLIVREGYKTYFIKGKFGYIDTREPLVSASSFSEFPAKLIDKDMTDALNWTANANYKIDEEFFDGINRLIYFQDDRGAAKKYNDLNHLRQYLSSRDDTYERFKAMGWLRKSGKAFSNHPFIDHRARIYDRGLIGPQSGETYRPFLNTAKSQAFSREGFDNFSDQVGAFLGGLDDHFEGSFNSLTIPGRQKIANRWRAEIVKVGNHMLRGKPADMRAILNTDLVNRIEGEELNKFFRFATESAKIDNFLIDKTPLISRAKVNYYTKQNLEKLKDYQISLALEQDASSSGAQIIALTTRNKQLGELSNVVPTTQKRRLYDEIAAATFNDPRFRRMNVRLGLSEKDLRKAAKAQNMVTFYGAGEKTGILNVERKLAKVLGRGGNTLVVKTSDRDTVLAEISARIARYQRFDPETTEQLRQLRNNVKDIFNKGVDPGDDIMEQLFFLDPQTKDMVGKMTKAYGKVVTPADFKMIANLMSEQLSEQVPILKEFTKFFGRLAEDYLTTADPSKAGFDWKSILISSLRGNAKKGFTVDDALTKTLGFETRARFSEALGLKAGEPITEKILRRFGFWRPDGNLAKILFGNTTPNDRRTGAKYFKTDILGIGDKLQVEVFTANKMPKSWTNIPWVNFDGKIIEQNFTQSFQEKLRYKDIDGNWVTNLLQVQQKTSSSWWDETLNKSGKINDIADVTKARTAFAVNGNHSNDATIVKRFHLWGKKNNVETTTIHDAFFANAEEMVKARNGLRSTYANALESNSIKLTLDEMRARGMSREIYLKYLNEAIELGLIPVAGRSRVGGRLMKESDILTTEDILQEVPSGFENDYGWYGVN